MKFALASCLVLAHCQDVFLAQSQLNLSTTTESDSVCVQRCHSAGYTCKGCSNTNCASSYGHPSCAIGCHIGELSTSEKDCERQCDEHDGGECIWVFRATLIGKCQGDDNCPNQQRRGATNYECKIGCRQAFTGHNNNGPKMNPQQALAAVNRIRASYGKKPMTWRADKKACADKAATYNAAHGAHKCGIDKVCQCGIRAAGDFNANDITDAIIRAYDTRNHEGPADGTCDQQSHCGALLDFDSIAIGYDESHAYAVIYYF